MNVPLFFKRLKKLCNAVQSKQSISALLFYRVLAASEHHHVLKPALGTIVDIGANRGQFSLAARVNAPNANIIAFEPLEKAADLYRQIFRKDSSVIFHQAAIGPQTGKAVMHVTAADDSSSLLPISKNQVMLYPKTNEVRREKVTIGPLSEYIGPEEINPQAMLKLDVQGFELQALIGSENLLDCFSFIYTECSFIELYTGQALANDVIGWLKERDFILRGIYNLDYDNDGNSVQADFLFKNLKND